MRLSRAVEGGHGQFRSPRQTNSSSRRSQHFLRQWSHSAGRRAAFVACKQIQRRERPCRSRQRTNAPRSARCTSPAASCCRNPWDVGSARALPHLGFKAIASTSAGFAWSIGKADNRVTARRGAASISPRCAMRSICPSTPISRAALRIEPEKVAANVARARQDRRRRIVDRGFHRRCGKSALRTRVRDRTHQGGAGSDRCRQQRRAVDRPLRRVFWSGSPIWTW